MKVRILLDQWQIGGISKKWQESAEFVQKLREWQMLRMLGAAELTIFNLLDCYLQARS
jgi:hypothetical protein